MHWEREWYKQYKKERTDLISTHDAKYDLYRSEEGQVIPDLVNSPAHYTRGNKEVIEIIEEAILDAEDPVRGMLQAQALKYLLRMWLKGNSLQDAEKARWYINRLISNLQEDRP